MADDAALAAAANGQDRLVSTLTVREMMDGSEPAALETIVLQPSGRLHLVGPWELSWDVDRE